MIRGRIQDFIVKFILIFPITTLLRELLPQINKVIMGMMLILLTVMVLFHKLTVRRLTILLCSVGLYIFSIYMTKEALFNLNDVFYFILWILFLLFLYADSNLIYEITLQNLSLIRCIVILWSFLFLVLQFLFHIDFMEGPHQLGSAALFIIVLNWLYVKNSKKYIYLLGMVVPLLATAFGGARTYFGIIVIYFGLVLYDLCKSVKKFLLCSFPLLIIMIIVILNTTIMDRWIVAFSDGYFDLWGMITSGRTVFWKADIDAFMALPVINKLFGYGYNFVYFVNYTAIYNYIWGHNDFINIMMCYGITGIYIYIRVFYLAIKQLCYSTNIKRILNVGLITIMMLNAFFNGLYNYTNAVLVIPFMYFSLGNINLKHDNQEEC